MKRTELALMVLQVPLDYIMLLLAGISAYYLRFTDWAIALKPVVFDLTLSEFGSYISLVAFGWIVIFAFVGLYSTNPNRRFASDMMRLIVGVGVGLAGVALYVMFTQQLFDSRFLVAAGAGFSVLYVAIGRFVMRGIKGVLYRVGIGLRKVAIIGTESVSKDIINTLAVRPELGYTVAGNYKTFNASVAEKMTDASVDEVILTNPRADKSEALAILDYCNERHIVFKYSADLFATYGANMQVHPLAGVPIVELRRTRLGAWGRVVKRLTDVVLSIVLIIITSPIMLVAAIAILIETGRPVLYKNERVGVRGKHFFAFKFRSMYKEDCTGDEFGAAGKKAAAREQELIEKQNSKEGPVYKIANDPRVTPLGKFIRRWSIDELPQFFNVLQGTMSIVGPRPHQPREVAGYEKKHKTVFTIKPGVTGLAQISGRSDLSFEEEMKLDVLYIERWSLLLDLIIFIKTPFILFKRRKVE